MMTTALPPLRRASFALTAVLAEDVHVAELDAVAVALEGADEARLKKVEAGRKRMLEKSTGKYLFKVEPLSAPDELIVYYCDMFPFQRVPDDPTTWLPRAEISSRPNPATCEDVTCERSSASQSWQSHLNSTAPSGSAPKKAR